jgi:hypothetical protein
VERRLRPKRLLFGFAAVFAADLALFLAAGGAVITTALFAGITRSEHWGSGGKKSEGEEGERQFHRIGMSLEFEMPAEKWRRDLPHRRTRRSRAVPH